MTYEAGLLLPYGRPVSAHPHHYRTLGEGRPTIPKPNGAEAKISASPDSAVKNRRLPALVRQIPLLHGAQTRLVQNAAIAGHTPGALSRLGTQRIQGHCAA